MKHHLPSRLSLRHIAPQEPNILRARRAAAFTGKVTVSGLTPGRQYRLLRFNSIAAVPTSGGAAAFLASPADSAVNFVATGQTWTYTDPVKIASDGVAYYRCVEVPSP